MTLDTPLARLIHARGLVPLEPLQRTLAAARAERPDGATLPARLVARGLLAPGVADGLLRELQLTDTLHASAVTAAGPPPTLGEGFGPGAVAGEYRVVRKLGQGGMGTVHEAEHLPTGARRALKVLPTGADPELLLRFQREAELLARVDAHPNVVRIHTVFQALGHQVLAMDLLPGGDLLRRLQARPLSPEEAVPLGAALARGLEHLHRHGVLHRDLKPHNVMFDELGAPRLVDFGLARAADAGSLTATGVVLGTPAYMAPEQARGEKVGPASDVYGLAALLFHALTGQAPYVGHSPFAVLAQVVTAPPPSARALAPGVPPALDLLLRRAMAKRSEERPASAAAFGEALAASLAPARPGRKAVAVGALVALAATGGLAALVVARGPAPAAAPAAPVVAAPAPVDSWGWTRTWSLATGRAPDLEPAALWRAGEAAPLEALRDPEALRAAFAGPAELLDDGRLRVRYPPAAVGTWRLPGHGVWSLAGPRPGHDMQIVRDDREAALVARVPRAFLHALVGVARWRDATLSLALRVPPSETHRGLIGIGLGDDDVAETRLMAQLDQSSGKLLLGGGGLDLEVRSRRRSLTLAPGGPPGNRVRIDGQPQEGLDAALAPRAPPGAIVLMAGETTLAVADLVVTGHPLSTDVEARARPPAAGLFARVTARFSMPAGEAPPTVEGGPFVALGEGPDELRLELQGWRVLLSLGELPVAVVATLDSRVATPALVGRLSLERAADRVRCEAEVGAGPRELVLLAPLPLRCAGRPSYGSGGRRARFTEVEVHAGPADPERERFDAGEGRDEPVDRARGGRALWRAGAAQLRAALGGDPWSSAEPSSAWVSSATAPAAALTLEAAVDAGGLSEPEARDALARALVAWIASGQREETFAALERLVRRAGGDEAAAAVVDGLAWRRGVPSFGESLAGQLQWFQVPGGARALALEVAERLVPASNGPLQARRGVALLEAGRCAEALRAFEEALAFGVPLEQLDAQLGRALVGLSRFADAVPHLERVVLAFPRDAELRRYLCDALGATRAPPAQQLEHALVLLVERRSTGNLERVGALARRCQADAPGLAAAALRCASNLGLRLEPSAQEEVQPPAGPAGARERNLEAWARDARPLRDDQVDEATFHLADGVERGFLDALVVDEVVRALQSDPLARALALSDPRLRELADRLR